MALTHEQRRKIGSAFIKHIMIDPACPPQGPDFTDYHLLIEGLRSEDESLDLDWYGDKEEILEVIKSLPGSFKVIDYKGSTYIAYKSFYDTEDLKEEIRQWMFTELNENSKVKVIDPFIRVVLDLDEMILPEFGNESYEALSYKPKASKVGPEYDDLVFKLIRNTARNKGFEDDEINSFLKIYDAIQSDEDFNDGLEPVEDKDV